jgi:hypothetical protein
MRKNIIENKYYVLLGQRVAAAEKMCLASDVKPRPARDTSWKKKKGKAARAFFGFLKKGKAVDLMQEKKKSGFFPGVFQPALHLAIPGPRLDSRHLSLCTHASISTPPFVYACLFL